MLPLTDPPRTRFECGFSLRTDKSLAKIAEEPPEATDPEEMDVPRTERASMRLAGRRRAPGATVVHLGDVLDEGSPVRGSPVTHRSPLTIGDVQVSLQSPVETVSQLPQLLSQVLQHEGLAPASTHDVAGHLVLCGLLEVTLEVGVVRGYLEAGVDEGGRRV